MSLSGRAASGRGRNRRNPLLALGAAVSIAGLGLYFYQRYAGQGTSIDSAGKDGRQGDPSSSSLGTKQKYRASLSLSLPITFSRNADNMALLDLLLTTLSQFYVITLIAPPPSMSTLKSDTPSPAIDSSLALGGVDSVAALSQSLSHIANFDSRRVLEYSKEEGRLALARALACDAHCEIMVESTTFREELHSKRVLDEEQDGEITPRATSPPRPVSLSNNAQSVDNGKVAILEQYHADMARIRKSSSLLVFLLLPVSSVPLRDGSSSSSLTVSELDVETVIQPFLLPGQQELSSRVPGVKVIDERRGAASAGISQAWSQAANRVASLSKGWQ